MKSEVKTCYTGGMSLLITSGGYNKPITNKKTYSHDFQDENLPFLLVQLPMYGYEDMPNTENWCIIRQAQEHIYRNTRSGVAREIV